MPKRKPAAKTAKSRDDRGRFAPGHSGNKSGRPAKVALDASSLDGPIGNLASLVSAASEKQLASIARNLTKAAASGDLKSIEVVLQLRAEAQRQIAEQKAKQQKQTFDHDLLSTPQLNLLHALIELGAGRGSSVLDGLTILPRWRYQSLLAQAEIAESTPPMTPEPIVSEALERLGSVPKPQEAVTTPSSPGSAVQSPTAAPTPGPGPRLVRPHPLAHLEGQGVTDHQANSGHITRRHEPLGKLFRDWARSYE